MDDAMAERARVVAWLRKEAGRPMNEDFDVGYASAMDTAADAIEAGDHDTIAIPRLSGDQKGAK